MGYHPKEYPTFRDILSGGFSEMVEKCPAIFYFYFLGGVWNFQDHTIKYVVDFYRINVGMDPMNMTNLKLVSSP